MPTDPINEPISKLYCAARAAARLRRAGALKGGKHTALTYIPGHKTWNKPALVQKVVGEAKVV